MKTLVEHMTSMIIMFILIFVLTIVISVGLQIMNARLIHTSAIEKLQSSFYTVSLDDINTNLDSNWYFEINELSSINTRKDYEVALNYEIKLPLFSNENIKGRIVGYAR